MENWRFIEENPDYMISDHGRVLSFKGKSKLVLCARIIGTGYEMVKLQDKGVYTDQKIHRLVAKAFIPNPKQLPQINHLDGNTLNNHVSNLEWCDAYTNTMHAIRTGLRPTGRGYHKTPCAVTDAKGGILRAYPSMKEMCREERLKPSHQNWLILQLKHPDRVWLHTLRTKQHRGNAFMNVPFVNSLALSKLPVFVNSLALSKPPVFVNSLALSKPPVFVNSPALSKLPVFVNSLALSKPSVFVNSLALSKPTVFVNSPTRTNTTIPPIHAPFPPVLHSMTKQYYRQLSAEEASAFGFISPIVRKQERRISQ